VGAPWVDSYGEGDPTEGGFLGEVTTFPNAVTDDDQVDAMTQYLNHAGPSSIAEQLEAAMANAIFKEVGRVTPCCGEIFARAVERIDGWLNTVTGVGTNYRRTAFTFESDGRLADATLAALFRATRTPRASATRCPRRRCARGSP
jgi:hypothetical protein